MKVNNQFEHIFFRTCGVAGAAKNLKCQGISKYKYNAASPMQPLLSENKQISMLPC